MAKEMKRVLRENTTVDTQTGEVLKRNYGAVLKRTWLRQALLRLPWRIHQERWSFSFAE